MASLSLSTNKTSAAYLEMHSNPNDPEPAYRSKMLEFLIFILKLFECSKILKILSLTLSLSGRVFKFLGKKSFLFLNLPLIILIFF